MSARAEPGTSTAGKWLLSVIVGVKQLNGYICIHIGTDASYLSNSVHCHSLKEEQMTPFGCAN